MSANAEKTPPTKSGRPCALERAADAWTRYAERLTFDAWDAWHQSARKMSREYSERAAYARGRAAGLREALRILAREN
jgi:hypothetical protein